MEEINPFEKTESEKELEVAALKFKDSWLTLKKQLLVADMEKPSIAIMEIILIQLDLGNVTSMKFQQAKGKN